MSEHPYRYGPYQAQQSHSQPHSQPLPPFAQQPLPSPNAQPPYYGAFQQPAAAASNYATAHNSFQYNASSIPGLGMGSSLPPTPYRTENINIWQPQPQPALHQLPTQATFNYPISTAKQSNVQKGPMEKRDLPVPSQAQKHTPEEGELSEGEFEDLYEPKDTTDVAAPIPQPSRPPSAMGNENGSVGDADGSSIYDGTTPRGEAVITSTSTSFPNAEREYSPGEDWDPSYQERERSGSYSPYLSPREIQRRVSVSKPAYYGIKQAQPTQNPVQSLPGINMVYPQQPSVDAPLSNGTSSNSVQDTAVRPFLSVAEAKKKAQEAILGLWPLKVRYQDYIEEGFDEKLIKGLFTDLGLEASIPKPAAAQKTKSEQQAPAASSNAAPESQNAKDKPLATSKPKPAATVEATVDSNDIKPTKKTAAEERKDKIARKLAAKAQKTASAVQPSAPTPPPQANSTNAGVVPSTNASPAKSKTRAETNALLHQKLAMLKKAQEKALAEKLAAENAAKPTTPSSVPASNPTTISVSKNTESSTNTKAGAITTSEINRRSASTETSLPREGGIPGLFLATQPAHAINRNLKRPVAADFDNYSTPPHTLKRTRTQQTLIIDVSDDEDVEMDIASPTDEPNSSGEIIHPPRQTPLAAFPPLSDSLNRKQRSSPSSSTGPTPPVHGAKLDLLHKRIEETKRLIAEAEAKKAAKKTNAPQSPQTQPSVIESTRTPRVSETPPVQTRVETADVKRRDRIVSYELPTVEATLKEKQDRLKEAVAKAAQLELEIKASMEQRRRLAEEAERLAHAAEPIPIGASTENEHVSPETATPQPSHVESQPSSEQQTNSEEMTDVSMTEGDITQPDQVVDLNDANLGIDPTRSTSTHNEILVAAIESSRDPAPVDKETQAEVSINGVQQNDSMTTSVEETKPIPSTVIDVSDVQVDAQDLSKLDGSEQRFQERSPSNDGSYQPQSIPNSPTSDTSRPQNATEQALSSQEESNLHTDKQLSCDVLDEAGPAQPGEGSVLSTPEKTNGEVQNNSSYEHPLLTSSQDEPEKSAQLEDLLYHSPLGYFRAYRFHPKYFDEVAGGLKSMTYSSKIDPMRPLCPHVLAGEQCPNGNACEFQHFENMVLPDAEIITQLGSADMFTGETRNRFIEGLKKVLNELKANKVKDFDRITKAIVKHRQEFLEDKSKILPLDAGSS
ncbi:uncharacterized protein F4812DRAFT_408584 [Daldinia caldariorum]|uniref:uncharacterized protein n=1 Tax=Daldinia caldariorum TaxID=326644 RepID=UPI002007D7D8|nr:uncharacterized protein F4812DRAFT_408584 [Daldinia caldariorum]KAI1472350.1 hypothetical protein F4812DRAFT_408584 [Daldinia caldariorum]